MASQTPPDAGRASTKNLPWLRLYVDIIEDPKLRRLPPDHRWCWITCLVLARKSPVSGTLHVTQKAFHRVSDIADAAKLDEHVVADAMEAFIELDMVEVSPETGAYALKHWRERQFESDTSTPRVQRHRQKKQVTDVPETLQERPGNGEETPSDNRLQSINPPIPPEGGRRVNQADRPYSEEFEQFWSVYPRKDEKRAAWSKWQTRLKDRVNPVTAAQLIVAARRYAEATRGSDHIKEAKTFLGPERPYEDYLKPGSGVRGSQPSSISPAHKEVHRDG